MRRAFCAICARTARCDEAKRGASSSAAKSVSTAKTPGLPYTSQAEWESEELSLVRRGLSPFRDADQRRLKPRAPPAHQDPAVLMERLGAMVDKLEIIEAVAKLRVAQYHALRPSAFNMLIQACMRTGKEQLAFDVFRDMKQRGLTPTSFTFAYLISGLRKSRSLNPRLLARVKSVHKEWVELYRGNADIHAQLEGKGNIPTTAYLSVLSTAGDIAAMYDTFYSMPKNGPLAPNLHTYTILLQALSKLSSEEERVGPAVAIWNMLCKDPNISVVDAHAFAALSEALLHASSGHRLAVLQIARECFGLQRHLPTSAEEAITALELVVPSERRRGQFEWLLYYKALSSIFTHLGALNMTEVATAWLRQILTEPQKAIFLESAQVEKLLWGLGQLGNAKGAEDILRILVAQVDPRHRPTRSAYAYALQACLKSKDFGRALRIFGMHSTGTCDEHPLFAVDQPAPRSKLDMPPADIKCLALLCANAHASFEVEQARRAVVIAESTQWLPWRALAPQREPSSEDPEAARSTTTALTAITDVGIVSAQQHALLKADQAEVKGDAEKAVVLRRRADTLGAADAGVRAHYLSLQSEGAVEDPDFVLRAASKEQALLREAHRNRFWEPKLARSLMRCLQLVTEGLAKDSSWHAHQAALYQYFKKGAARGVSVTKPAISAKEGSTATGEAEAGAAPDASHALAALMIADVPMSAHSTTAVVPKVDSVGANPPALRSLASLSQVQIVDFPRGTPLHSSGARGARTPALKPKKPRTSKKVLRMQRRLALQGVKTRRRPRPDLIQDRRIEKLAKTKLARLADIRPGREAGGRRFV